MAGHSSPRDEIIRAKRGSPQCVHPVRGADRGTARRARVRGWGVRQGDPVGGPVTAPTLLPRTGLHVGPVARGAAGSPKHLHLNPESRTLTPRSRRRDGWIFARSTCDSRPYHTSELRSTDHHAHFCTTHHRRTDCDPARSAGARRRLRGLPRRCLRPSRRAHGSRRYVHSCANCSLST